MCLKRLKGQQVETGGKFRICRNYSDISYPKPVFESFFAKMKFCLTPILKKRNCYVASFVTYLEDLI